MGKLEREYTVACAARKAIRDPEHLDIIKNAVARVHECTFAATELLNLYVRDRIENHDATGLEGIFKQNWLMNAYHVVSDDKKSPKIDANVQSVFDAYMKDSHSKTSRDDIRRIFEYECKNLAAVGTTNVWMHFRKRVLAYTRTMHAMDEKAYAALSKDGRRARKLALMQAAEDVCRSPDDARRAPLEYYDWIDATRQALRIDDAVGVWGDKPLLYHLKSHPHRFLWAMQKMSLARRDAGRRAFALFPLRRSHVPGFARFDERILCTLLKISRPGRHNNADDSGVKTSGKRKRDDPSLQDEKRVVFDQVLDLRAAGVHRCHHFAFGFVTDGVSLHVNMTKPKPAEKPSSSSTTMPRRGIHSIDSLKQHVRKHGAHVIGIDPGKRELVVAVDSDDPKSRPVVRYTLAQRRHETCVQPYATIVERGKPESVRVVETELSLLDSRAPALASFAEFVAKRRKLITATPAIAEFYAHDDFRHRRRKGKLKAQQSEARLVKRLRAMHDDMPRKDSRPLVLAYGAWGLAAGRPGIACNKGNPPAVGVGFMKRLARDFVVMPTPEHFTSKTCVKCGGLCGPHPTLRTKDDKKIRGLLVCQHVGCGLPQNRDKTGATNIGKNGCRLLLNQAPIRSMTEEDVEFYRINVCVENS